MLQFGMLADREHVVEVVGVVGRVLLGRIVDGHAAQPADEMLRCAVLEESDAILLELAGMPTNCRHAHLRLNECLRRDSNPQRHSSNNLNA